MLISTMRYLCNGLLNLGRFLPRKIRLLTSNFACVGQVVGQMRKRRQNELAAVLPFSLFDPHFLEIYVVNAKIKLELLTQKNRLKRRFFKESWSE